MQSRHAEDHPAAEYNDDNGGVPHGLREDAHLGLLQDGLGAVHSYLRVSR